MSGLKVKRKCSQQYVCQGYTFNRYVQFSRWSRGNTTDCGARGNATDCGARGPRFQLWQGILWFLCCVIHFFPEHIICLEILQLFLQCYVCMSKDKTVRRV